MSSFGYTVADPVVASHAHIICCIAEKQDTATRIDCNAWDAWFMGWGPAGVVEGAGAVGTVANHAPCPDS